MTIWALLIAVTILLRFNQTLLASEELPCPNNCVCNFSESLAVIQCDGRNLTSLPYLPEFEFDKKNRKVDLLIKRNRIGYILWHSLFSLNGKLRILEITDNEQEIEVVKTAFEPFFDSLEVLRLDPLAVDFSEEIVLFAPLSSLLELSINLRKKDAQSKVWSIPFFRSDSSPRLKLLELTHCGLRGITMAACGQLSLETLNLRHNMFTEIPKSVTAMMASSLTRLSMANNQIQAVKRDNIPEGCLLKFLDLSFNKIALLEEGSLGKCGQLQIVNLSYNTELVTIGARLFLGHVNLLLDLDHTSISRLDFIQPYQVIALKVQGVKIQCTCDLQMKIRPLFGYKLRGTCTTGDHENSGSSDLDISNLDLKCQDNRRDQSKNPKKNRSARTYFPIKTSQPIQASCNSLQPSPTRGTTATPTLSQEGTPPLCASISYLQSDVVQVDGGDQVILLQSSQTDASIPLVLVPVTSPDKVTPVESAQTNGKESTTEINQSSTKSVSASSTEDTTYFPSVSHSETQVEHIEAEKYPSSEPFTESKIDNSVPRSQTKESLISTPIPQTQPLQDSRRSPELLEIENSVQAGLPPASYEPGISITHSQHISELDVQSPTVTQETKPQPLEVTYSAHKQPSSIDCINSVPAHDSAPSGNEQPPLSLGVIFSAHEPPSLAHEPSSSVHKLPSPAHEPPSSVRKLPSPAHEPPSSARKLPSPAHKPSSSARKLPSPAHKPPSSARKLPSPAHKLPSPEHEQPSLAHEPPSSAHELPSLAHEPPSSVLKTISTVEEPEPTYPVSRTSKKEDITSRKCPQCYRHITPQRPCRCRQKKIARQVRIGLKRAAQTLEQKIRPWIIDCPIVVLACFFHACLTFVAFLTLDHSRLK